MAANMVWPIIKKVSRVGSCSSTYVAGLGNILMRLTLAVVQPGGRF
jgi:hypothetical protein